MSTGTNPFASFGLGRVRVKEDNEKEEDNPFAQFDSFLITASSKSTAPSSLSTRIKSLPAVALQAHKEAGRGLLQGLSDPIWGGAQVLAHSYASAAKNLIPQSQHAQWVQKQVCRWWRALDAVRQRVLVNMCFNLGMARLLQFTKTLSAIEHGAYEQAADHMLNSLWARQVKGRAITLAQRMRKGESG